MAKSEIFANGYLSYEGEDRIVTVPPSEVGYVIWGPYEHLKRGKYLARFDVRAESPVNNAEAICRLDICRDHGRFIIRTLVVSYAQILDGGGIFDLPFEMDIDGEAEYRVFSLGVTGLRIKYERELRPVRDDEWDNVSRLSNRNLNSQKLLEISADELDRFIITSDALGGPGSMATSEYWNTIVYKPSFFVDQSLDPYSKEYSEQQIKLYREISGKEIDQNSNEMTQFNIDEHIYKSNPYGNADPSDFVLHFLRLSFAIRRAKLPSRPRILDMGAGWGLSSEFFAMLGSRVTAMDINPAFVELINRRQAIHRNDVSAVVGGFDSFEPDGLFDAVFFYECLHHAVEPWRLIDRARTWLSPGGKIIFAGEPVNNFWWRNWGLRLSPMSIYCIRKLGWFESGWSREFIIDCFSRSGFTVIYEEISEPEVGSILVAEIGS